MTSTTPVPAGELSTGAEQLRSLRFGWTWLFLWACFGIALEAMHGFKIGGYLDDELGRLLLRLGHAHGVGTALVVLVYSAVGVPLLRLRPDGGRRVGRWLRAGAVALPMGFAASALGHPEGDPSLAILLVPVGALLILLALGALMSASFGRSAADAQGQDPVDR